VTGRFLTRFEQMRQSVDDLLEQLDVRFPNQPTEPE
jgi:hypothetical protein